MNAIVKRMNIFARLDAIEAELGHTVGKLLELGGIVHDIAHGVLVDQDKKLTDTTVPAVSINEAVDRHDEQLVMLEISAEAVTAADVHDHEQRLVALEANFQRLIVVTDNHADEVNALNEVVGIEGVTDQQTVRRTPIAWKEKIASYLADCGDGPIRQIDIIRDGLGWKDDTLGQDKRRRFCDILREAGWTRIGSGGRHNPYRWVSQSGGPPRD